MMKRGQSLNSSLINKKAFKNPDILEKLVAFCDINEIGTNYPKELYDPTILHKDDFYDEILKQYSQEIERREKQQRTQIDFRSSSTINSSSNNNDIKSTIKTGKDSNPPSKLIKPPSKWDQIDPEVEKKMKQQQEEAPKAFQSTGNAYAAFM